jgi:hypothetical protein
MSRQKQLRVIVIGAMIPGSRTIQRTRAARQLGHRVSVISTVPDGRRYEDPPSLSTRIRYRLRLPEDPVGANERLFDAAQMGCDLVWMENAPLIRRRTLERVRNIPSPPRIAWFAEDDMMSPRHGSWFLDRSLHLFDLWVTTKSFNALPDEMPARGVRRILFVNNSFDPQIHRPVEISPQENERFGCGVCFVGTYERPRAESLLHLARSGIRVRVWGSGWKRARGSHPLLQIENRTVYDDDYTKVICASSINLAFLRKSNRDLQTTRSMEIPACGGFMLHERNSEITALFRENEEAGYFSDDQELVVNCQRWLADEADRRRIAAAGHQEALSGGYTHHDILRTAFDAATDSPAISG